MTSPEDYAAPPIPFILCVNKIDLPLESRGESKLDCLETEEGTKDFADNNDFFEYCRVSAKTGAGVYDMFKKLTNEVYKLDMIRKAQIEKDK